MVRSRIRSAWAPSTTITGEQRAANRPVNQSRKGSPRYRNNALGKPQRHDSPSATVCPSRDACVFADEKVRKFLMEHGGRAKSCVQKALAVGESYATVYYPSGEPAKVANFEKPLRNGSRSEDEGMPHGQQRLDEHNE